MSPGAAPFMYFVNKKLFIFFIPVILLSLSPVIAQTIPAGSLFLEEILRRKQLLGEFDSEISFNLRPFRKDYGYYPLASGADLDTIQKQSSKRSFLLPLSNHLSYHSGRPYGYGNGMMIPNVGFQNLITTGVGVNFHFVKFQLQPELLWAQNRSYNSYPNNFSDKIHQDRFLFWNNGDHPERFGRGHYSAIGWGQSSFRFSAGAFEFGLSTENIWWGPGQFNALIFSRNARGFPHLSLNTTRPAKTFLGSFEGQILMGRLEPSGFEPSQHPELNDRYFRNLSPDWRYVNGLSVSYQPKWIPGFFVGLNRTFQQYNRDKDNSFPGWFPIFQVFTKEKLFEDGHTIDYDSKAQDQQVSLFGRYLVPAARAEVYFEFGRRDHSYNWREFLLNPEHARAYLFGFSKLVAISGAGNVIQVRGEMTQQQESVNRYIRYPGVSGGTSWHSHYQVRGFTHYGESLGVGIGSGGSNVQTLEVSLIDGLNKYGILMERLANQQDFYYRAFGQQQERQPWVDLSIGFLLDYRWNRVMLSSKLQLIRALNYQWGLDPKSSPEFPVGMNKLDVFAQSQIVVLMNP